MKLRKIVTLGLLCTLGLVACKNDSTTPTTTPTQPSTVEPKPSTGDSTTTEKPADRDAVYNVLSKLKTTKAASINYTLEGEEYTDIFNKDYVMFNRFGQGVALLPSYDPSETNSDKAVYMFDFNDTDIVLDKVMADQDKTTGALIYETSIDSYNNAYQIGRQISKNRLSVDKESGDIYTTNTTLLKTIAGAVGFQYATLVQGGTAYFYLSEDETSVEVSLTAYYKKSADSTGTKVLTEEFDPIYFNDIGTAVSDTFGDVLADGDAFLGASLTDDEISNVVSKPVKYHTPLSSLGYAEVAYGTKDGQNIASTHQVVYSGKDADGNNLVGNESMGYYVGDSTQVKYMTLTAANEVYDSGALTSDSGQKYTWDIAIADLSNTEVFNPKAFRKVKGSDTYKYLGYSIGAENIFYGLSFLSADDFGGEYNSLSVTLGSNDKVESFNYTVAFRDSSTGSIQGGITFKTTIENGDSVAPTLPTAYTQEAEEDKIAEGLKKLNGSVSFSMTSSMTVEGTSLNAISVVYYYDKTNKTFIAKQSSGSTESVRGWKEATDNAVTPFKIENDNSLTARNVDIKGHIADLFTPALSPALLKKKLGSENDYVLRTTLATGISSSMLFGPAASEGMIPSTMVFHTDSDGTIQSISYTYSIYNSNTSAYERGTETLTFAYDTAAVNPTTADLSSAIKAYVKPTSWKEQSEAIYKDIVSAIGETEAATVPFLFDSNYAEDGWASQYNPNGFTMIVGSASSSSAATTFLTNYLTYVQKQGFQSGGTQDGIYIFVSPNNTYILGVAYSNGSPIILVQPVPASAN